MMPNTPLWSTSSHTRHWNIYSHSSLERAIWLDLLEQDRVEAPSNVQSPEVQAHPAAPRNPGPEAISSAQAFLQWWSPLSVCPRPQIAGFRMASPRRATQPVIWAGQPLHASPALISAPSITPPPPPPAQWGGPMMETQPGVTLTLQWLTLDATVTWLLAIRPLKPEWVQTGAVNLWTPPTANLWPPTASPCYSE